MNNLGKENKKKPYKSMPDNAFWSWKQMFRYAPKSLVLQVIQIPCKVFLAYAGIYLPSLVLAEVTGNDNFTHAVLRVGLFLLLMYLVNAVYKFSDHAGAGYLLGFQFSVQYEIYKKNLTCFYQEYESKKIRDLSNRALGATVMQDGIRPITVMPKTSLECIENIVCYCLFGSVISFVNPWLLSILTLAPTVNWFCARAYRNWEYNNREKWSDIDKKLWYVQNKPADFSMAKDIRIYGMAGWLKEIYTSLCTERSKWDKKNVWRKFLSRIADLVVILLRDGAAYAMLISMTLQGEITVDKFLLYFSAISSFTTYVGNIMNGWNRLNKASLRLCDLREYLELEEQTSEGKEKIEKHLHSAPEICFENVSFCYDGAEKNILDNISFTIKQGEKVALVGLNGAGKTTLVKLMCGLYLPTKGDIKINGVSVRDFKREEYHRLFSPVFQDVKTAYFSLAETVSGQIGEGTDLARAEKCMRVAGLGEKIDVLPNGIHTKLDKQLYEDGIELSGGEVQKLMLARALYKNAPVLVLDEPTAALDPIAEHNIYVQYRKMTEEKSSLFISHRLASTQFCDRILYLKDGKIAEEGTHQELVALGGEYSQLFEMQSCWYREDYKGEAVNS